MSRFELYVCIGDVCDDEPLVFDDQYRLLEFIHGVLRINERVNRIIIKKVDD